MALVPLVSVVFLIWESRKVIARMQDRLGPTNAGTLGGAVGLFQTVADAIKILTKELIIPEGADKGVFIIAPMLVVAVAIAMWAVIPLGTAGDRPAGGGPGDRRVLCGGDRVTGSVLDDHGRLVFAQ